ncbi:MAG: hypothetical protein A2719_01055 [Candidatus Ryanbacteria bacterium RIFCSPHIGHO2_01_FULL_45_22]|uniref:Uncharacterized protein n=1 Tax=Candidatus Ryanbacteria bacterium RIFCSPHIGHO2_01_FULL_45_22 TaxID=1802114 RepID=A0A1G2FYW5_9BACT|nr:MAG: hypothetical protein A2719_01055 [Candidatus Ryanbacteria bacterium RIFCSPHIGHO2_01_FULL_45_22]
MAIKAYSLHHLLVAINACAFRKWGRYIAVFFFVAVTVLGIVTSAYAASSQQGGDFYQEDEKISNSRRISAGTGEFYGDFSYSYPIAIPAGRNGLQPTISLSYSSNSADQQSSFGYGWSVSVPYIERINREGVETLYSRTYFYSSLDGELASTTSTQYGAKVENGSFRKYEMSTSTSGWTVTDKNGTVYTFGAATSTRMDDPDNGYKVYRWYLDEVRDTNDNYISYSYFKDRGQVYIATSTYTGYNNTAGPFTVEFYHEPRNDIASSSEFGFWSVSAYRINEIQVAIDGSWVRTYALGYTTGDNDVRSMLDTITESGKDEAGVVVTLPAVNFNYQSNDNSWTRNTTWEASGVPQFNLTTDHGVTIADVNGDGLADMVEKRGTNPAKLYINKGDNTGWYNWSDSPQSTSSIPCISSIYAAGDVRDCGTRFIDVNGDGFADILYGQGSSTKAYINNGDYSGWTLNATWAPPKNFVNSSQADSGLRIGEVNGDGLPDLVYSATSSAVYINTGHGWSQDTGWTVPIAFIGSTTKDLAVRLLDINGDGLSDLIRASDDDAQANSVFLNTGRKSWEEDTKWVVPEAFEESTGEALGVRLVDVNGDNLVDFVRSDDQGSGGSTVQKVYLNRGDGTGWTQDTQWSIPIGFVDSNGVNQGTRIEDVNGDGIADLLRSNDFIRIHLTNGKKADLLTKITHSEGGHTVISYKPAQQYTSGGTLLNPHVPFVVYTVENIEEHDGLSATTSNMTYNYRGGDFYYGFARDRKFAGFGTTTVTDAAGNVTKTYFQQGNDTDSAKGEYSDDISKIGKPYRIEQYDGPSNLYAKTINKWENYDLGYKRDFVKLTRTTSFSYDGDLDHAEKAEEYTYSNSTGNLTEKVEYGKVSGNDDGTFTDTSTDKFTSSISYAASSTPYIMARPSVETVTDQSAVKVKETKFYYDDLANGSVDKGNETKRERWKTSSTYASTTRAYNTYGLVTEETDGLGHETTFTYDARNLYAATSTNPISQVTGYAYDYTNGKPKRITNPNGFIFETTFDGLDRTTEEKQPDLATPTTRVSKTTYIYTDAQPPSVQETHNLDGSTSFLVYKYFDGFGRIVQERKEAEDTNTYSVHDYTYNNRGLLNIESLPYFGSGPSKATATTSSALFITYAYDALQRPSTISNAVGVTSYAYDDWKTTVTDAESNTKRLTKDAYGRLEQVAEYTEGSATTTSYEYNYLGNLTKITDPAANVRNFTYDGLGRRLTAQDLHDTGDATYGTWTYTYDDVGNLSTQTDPDSKEVDFTYDDTNRVLTENYTGSAGTEIEYGYDGCPNGAGFLCSATSTDAVTNYRYNALGGIATSTVTINSIDYATGFNYDRQGNQAYILYPDSSKVAYTYNTAGLLEVVSRSEPADAGYTTVISDFDYAPTEQVTLMAYHNGAQTTRSYDRSELYRLRQLKTEFSGAGGAGLNEDIGYLVEVPEYDLRPQVRDAAPSSATTAPELFQEPIEEEPVIAPNETPTEEEDIIDIDPEDTTAPEEAPAEEPATDEEAEEPTSPEETVEDDIVDEEETVTEETPAEDVSVEHEKAPEIAMVPPITDGLPEIREKRTWNSKTFNTGSTSISEIHPKVIHYKDASGAWQDQNLHLRDTGTQFEMDKAPFSVTFPKTSTGDATFTANSHWDYKNKTDLNEPPLTKTTRAIDAVDVVGIQKEESLLNIGWISYVEYAGAFPDADLLYTTRDGVLPARQQLLRFDEPLTEDTTYCFEMSYDKDVKIKQNGNEWDKAHKLRTKDSLQVHVEDTRRGISTYPFFMWDSNEETEKKQSIDVEIEKHGNTYALCKTVPASFFTKDTVYPVYADDTDTFSPDANAESGSVDGFTDAADSTFSGAVNQAGDRAFDDMTTFQVHVGTFPPGWILSRGIVVFETDDVITSGAAVTYGDLQLTARLVGDPEGGHECVLDESSALVDGTDSGLVAGDYDAIQTTEIATRLPISGMSVGERNVDEQFVLNSAGLSWIKDAGDAEPTRMALRLDADFDVVAPTLNPETIIRCNFDTADAGGGNEPVLTVEWFTNRAPTFPTTLTTESQINPTDISDPTPEFSAIYNDPDSGDLAPYYRIQVSTSSIGAWAHAYWDSGTSTMATTTQGNRSPDISYAGSALASSTIYYWRIRFSDDDGREGAWSMATSTFKLAESVASTTTNGIQNFTYTYDAVGNITKIVDLSETDTQKTIAYTYDDLYRLLSASTTLATTTQSNYKQTYSYNSIGNITNKSDVGSYTYAETNYANPHAATDINGATQTYSRSGNLLSNGTWNYRYDYKGQLTKATTTAQTSQFGYDHTGTRVYLKEGVTATTTYANKLYSIQGATTTKHIFANGMLVATVEHTSGGGGGTPGDTGFKTTGTVEVNTGWGNMTTTRINTSNNSDAACSATCDNSDDAQLSDYSFGIPSGATIDGIEVVTEMAEGASADTILVDFSLSWNDGTSWTSVKTATVDGTTDTDYTVGGSSDTWGRSWTDTEFANGTFRLRLDKNPSVDNLFVDYLRVKVYYTTGGGGGSSTTTIAYIHQDHLGGTHAITDSNGELVQTADYYPYGSLRVNNQAANFNEKRKFTGYEHDDSTGLNYAGVRYQNPTDGRWISQDPASRGNPEKFLQNPQALNSYSYAENNPIIKRDPNGEFVPQAVALGALYGGVSNVALQAYSDYQKGTPFSLKTYASSFGKGATVGAAAVYGAIPATIASIGYSFASNYFGEGITADNAVSALAEGTVTGLTAGFVKGLPGVSGPQASRIFGGNYFTGAHGARYAWEAMFGLSTDVYFKNIQNVTQGFINSYQSQSQQSSGGFNAGNTGINQVSQAVINYANTPGADLSDPGFTSSLGAINEYNNNLGKQ